MDEDLLLLILAHAILLGILTIIYSQAKRKKPGTALYRSLIGIDIIIIVLTMLGLAGVFGALVATDGFVIGMYSFFGSCFIVLIAILGFIIQQLVHKANSR